MSSNLHVRRAMWADLLHEVATVQAISTAAVEAKSDESRTALLKLLEAETAEVVALVHEVGREYPSLASEAS
ncbi:hypothetical protein [Kribbella sp. CA-293567]|uniref:hypothetical protein n=1 Tax=Kribbella sp. CA-293567 TaxID=3002436 RepID=UPI0022DD7320|nr:hypothetical protein [Kribbella sp. CA-293567]WBQ05880.1 hypothetical protein OX958_03540 [Kribbella sp. CA-293567]